MATADGVFRFFKKRKIPILEVVERDGAFIAYVSGKAKETLRHWSETIETMPLVVCEMGFMERLWFEIRRRWQTLGQMLRAR